MLSYIVASMFNIAHFSDSILCSDIGKDGQNKIQSSRQAFLWQESNVNLQNPDSSDRNLYCICITMDFPLQVKNSQSFAWKLVNLNHLTYIYDVLH